MLSARVSNGQQMTARDYFWNWGYRGAGGVLCSARHMQRWLTALQRGDVLDEETLSLLLTPADSGFALGWQVQETSAGARRVFHGGTTGGYHTYVIWHPDEQASIVVLTNEDHSAEAIAGTIERMLFPIDQPRGVAIKISAFKEELDADGQLTLDQRLRWSVRTESRGIDRDGTAIFDDRILIVVWDQRTNEWPVMISVDDDTARQWHARLIELTANLDKGEGAGSALMTQLDFSGLTLDPVGPVCTLPESTVIAFDVTDDAIVMRGTLDDGRVPLTITMNAQEARTLADGIEKALRRRGAITN